MRAVVFHEHGPFDKPSCRGRPRSRPGRRGMPAARQGGVSQWLRSHGDARHSRSEDAAADDSGVPTSRPRLWSWGPVWTGADGRRDRGVAVIPNRPNGMMGETLRGRAVRVHHQPSGLSDPDPGCRRRSRGSLSSHGLCNGLSHAPCSGRNPAGRDDPHSRRKRWRRNLLHPAGQGSRLPCGGGDQQSGEGGEAEGPGARTMRSPRPSRTSSPGPSTVSGSPEPGGMAGGVDVLRQLYRRRYLGAVLSAPSAAADGFSPAGRRRAMTRRPIFATSGRSNRPSSAPTAGSDGTTRRCWT